MNRRLITSACCAIVLASGAAAQESRNSDDRGPFPVRTVDEEWTDANRNRTIAVRIFVPESPVAAASRPGPPYPLILLSPGLGGSRTSYGYLASHLASHGYLVVALTHPGSDTKDFGERIRRRVREGGAGAASRPLGVILEAVDDPENLRHRPRDVSFAIDRMMTHPALGTLVDSQKIGVAGHSFGAHTAMALGGMTVDLPDDPAHSFRDARVKAVLPMSPEGPGTMGISPGAWDRFAVPVLFLTGTRDYGVGERSTKWRRSGFDSAKGVDRWLVTIEDAGHMTFAMPGRGGGRGTPNHQKLIQTFALEFFDAWVKDEGDARTWLEHVGQDRSSDCAVEFAPGSAVAESRADRPK